MHHVDRLRGPPGRHPQPAAGRALGSGASWTKPTRWPLTGTATKVNKTQRYEFGEFLRDRTDHFLFLTATPHKGDPDNFALLLQLLDRDLYVTGNILAEASAHDENRIMIRRLKEDMKKFDGSPCFPPRHVQTLPYKLTADELNLYDAVTDYVQNNFQRAEPAENRNVGLALTVLQRRLASSLAAIRLSLERRLQTAQGSAASSASSSRSIGELPDDLDDLTEADRWKFEDDLVERLTMAENMAELEAEIEELDRLVRSRQAHREERPGNQVRGTPQRRFRAPLGPRRAAPGLHRTQGHARLPGRQADQPGLPLLHDPRRHVAGETDRRRTGVLRAKALDHGRHRGGGRGHQPPVLLLMVNYDIPWNPNRLEQRMGRIHRYKQQQEVMIFNLVAKNTREGEVMDRLLRKLEDMRQALGSDRVYDVIGEIIPAPKFDALMKDWLSRRRTMTEILAEIDLQTDEEQVARIRADMQDKALGSRYIDMSKLAGRSAAEQRAPAHARVHREVLRRGIPLVRRHDHAGQGPEGHLVDQPSAARPAEAARATWNGSYGKIGTAYPQITFDKEQVVGYSDLEFVGPGHPLFEGVVERVLREYGPSLRQGAVFYNADATEPTVLWLLKCGVEDGRGQTVGERLFAIHWTASRFRKSQPYALLDLKTPESRRRSARGRAPGGHRRGRRHRLVAGRGDARVLRRDRRAPRPGAGHQGEVRPQVAPVPHRRVDQEDRQVRQPAAADAGRKRPEAAEHPGQPGQGGGPPQAELSQRLKDRLAEIEQEQHLSEKPPEILGVAVILPPPQEVVASVEGMESDPEVEAIAVEMAKKYEIEPGPQAGVGRGGELRLGYHVAAGRPGRPLHRGQGPGRRRRRGPDAERMDQGPAVRQGLLALRRGQLQDEARTLT